MHVGATMTLLRLKNFQLLDPDNDALRGGYEILIEGEKIREVSDRPISSQSAATIDCGGRTVMPGLIDCHVHVFLSEVVIRRLEDMPLTLMTARAAVLMRNMLDRGFTTVRDTGGADWGIKSALEQGLLPGPRLFIAGKAIGPTGGHSDGRRRTDPGTRCHCCNAMVFTMAVADGEADVRRAVREEMRQGCDHVKIMMSGGVASPYDPLESLQFSPGEVAAAVEEANAFGRYVCAHAYSPEAITRAAKAGVLGLAKAMARELGSDNVRVNSVTPGLIQTDITGGKLTDELRAEILKGIPLNRLGDAEDVARSCLFLASELSSYITGATLDVNGGMLIH